MDKDNKTSAAEQSQKLPKKKLITLMIAALLILALGIGYILIPKFMPENSENTENGQTGNQNTESTLFSENTENFACVTIKNSDGRFVISNDGDKISITPENPDLTEQMLKSYLAGYSEITAKKEVENGKDRLLEYGISKDDNFFEITLKNGKTHRFCIGNKSTAGDYYYCLDATHEKVWLVASSSSANLIQTPKLKAQSEVLSVAIDHENIYYVSVSLGQKELFSVKSVSNTTALPYNFYSTYELTYPYHTIAQSPEFTEFLKSLSYVLTPETHMGLASEKSAEYGIGRGYNLVVKDSQKTHNIRFGNKTDIGVYMTYNDYPYVYLVSDKILTSLENADPISFITPYIDLYEVDTLKEITVDYEGLKYTVTVDNTNKKYTVNGKNLSKDKFKEFFDALTDITAYKDIESNPQKGEKFFTISYALKDGKIYKRTYFKSSSAMSYITATDEGLERTVKKSSADKMLNIIKNINK